MTAAGIARRLGGKQRGNSWRCDCPICGYDLSLSTGENGQLLARCFGPGPCSFDEICLALVEYGLLDDGGVVLDCSEPIKPAHSAMQDAYRIERARQLYAATGSGPLVPNYVGSRGISLVPPAALRDHPHCPHRLGIRLPAMVAPVVDANGTQIGVHMTYLRSDGSGKAKIGKEFQRECRGVIRGGAVRLGEFVPDRPLLLGEGVESVLSAMQLFDMPGWAAVYAANLKDTLELPSEVQQIVIAADNDLSGAGQRAAIGAHERWTSQGRCVRIALPPVIGDDFNDVLRKGRG